MFNNIETHTDFVARLKGFPLHSEPAFTVYHIPRNCSMIVSENLASSFSMAQIMLLINSASVDYPNRRDRLCKGPSKLFAIAGKFALQKKRSNLIRTAFLF